MATHSSSLSVTFAGHSTVLLEMDGVRLLTDPLLRRRIGVLIRRSPVPAAGGAPRPRRRPHLARAPRPPGRAVAAPDRPADAGGGAPRRRRAGAPARVRARWRWTWATRWRSARQGGRVAGGRRGAPRAARVRVKAVPADHSGTRYPLAAESPALGYVVEGGLSAYFAGDTGLYDGDERPGAARRRRAARRRLGAAAAGRPPRTRSRRPRRCNCCGRPLACPSTGAPSTRRGCRRNSTPSGPRGRMRSPATPRTSRRRSRCASCSPARPRCSAWRTEAEEAAPE